MNYEDLIKKWGTAANLARKLGISRAAVSQWKTKGIPELRVYQLKCLKKP